MDVVVVESPAKAKSINRYLGSNFKVLASYGHVRDLPAQDGSVRPDQDFSMEWTVDPKARAHVNKIAEAARGARHLYLATDPDREGEAIAWHVLEVLKERKALKDLDVKRVVFHEVTKRAVTNAIANPRSLDGALVNAYLARRALDYLVGFSLSPVLWRKLPGSRSAGRVQSVALRLLCERESEIEIFEAREYWTIEAVFLTPEEKAFTARLTHLNGKKLDRYDLGDESAAAAAVAEIERHDYDVRSIEKKTVQRKPSPPFTTSTLQQEASRKLRLSASQTMRLAQRLYEGVDVGGETIGLITYMRTDSVNLSQEAVISARAVIGREFGHNYMPNKPNTYRNKAKNAQEAHEAIRPTDFARSPGSIAGRLSRDELRLYELIWKRALSSQMANAVLDQTSVDVASPAADVMFRATGSVVRFDGFMRLYTEGIDDQASDAPDAGNTRALLPTSGRDNDEERILPPISEGDRAQRNSVTPEQHFTKPPPRFTEASLVKRLEELGIGRPSTYAAILQVLQDREYVSLDSRRFVPSDLGRLVTAFLTEFFRRYVENDFTARMEDGLDDVSNGTRDWKSLLAEFWKAFSAAIDNTDHLRTRDVIDKLDSSFANHFFRAREDGRDPRICPACGTGRLGLKPKGFIGCSNYPECRFTSSLTIITDEVVKRNVQSGPRLLGEDPETGLPVTVRTGPYGPYVQLGEAEKGKKPKRQSLLEDMLPDGIDLEHALALLSLPREIGEHPETREMIIAGVGRYGPYLRMGKQYAKLRDDEVLTVGLNRAVAALADSKTKQPAKSVLKTLGSHPRDGKPVELRDGRYGPYVKHGSTNATLPAEQSPETATLEQALEWLAQKEARAKGSKRSRAGSKKRHSPARPRSRTAAIEGPSRHD